MTLPLSKLSTTSENFGSCSLCFFSSLFFFFFFFSPLSLIVKQFARSFFSPTTTPVCPFAIPWINNWTNMRVRKHDENFNRWLSVRSLVQNYLLISLFHRLFPYTLFHTLLYPISVSYSFCLSLSLFFSMGVAARCPATRNSLLSFHINLLGNLVFTLHFCAAKNATTAACLSDHRTRFAVIKRALMYLFLSTASCLEGNGECESLRLMSNLGQRNIWNRVGTSWI